MSINFIDKLDKKDSLILFVAPKDLSQLSTLDIFANTDIANVISAYEFEAKPNQILELKAFASFKKIVLAAIDDSCTNANLNKLGGMVADYVKNEENITLKFIDNNNSFLEAILIGILVKSYAFDKYVTNEKNLRQYKIKNVNILDFDKTLINLKEIEAIYKGIKFTKNLVNEPANSLYPATYVAQIKELEALGLEVEVLNKEKCAELKMESFLAVSKGSDKEPYVVVIKHLKGKKDDAPLAFVGKGVTFDTGGYSLKPPMAMIGMTKDMAGSAAVVGLMKTLAIRDAKVNAIGVIGLVENCINGSAMKPGDIVKAMNGKTIEILNTDAEGRLVLADILYYSSVTFKPKIMINLATLTGAMIVALGSERGGMFSNNQDLANKLLECSELSGDLLWQLPMGDEYKKSLKSTVADLQNISTSPRIAGSIFAAKFLEEFVNETPWAHLDIAGVADTLTNSELHQKGATAFGVKVLNTLVKKYYEN